MLSGKRVFVTGGTGHLGAAICRACHRHGARVAFSYHRAADAALALADELPGALAVALDLRDVSAIAAVCEGLTERLGGIDVLVNNAGISQVMPLPLVEESDLDLVLAVNVKGTFFVTKAVVRGMIRNRCGTIVNVGSIAGSRLLDVPVSYAMSKAAIHGMTFALAAELKRFGIRVNAVVPGLIDGGVGEGVPESLRKDFIAHCAVGRAGRAAEVAEAVCFLGSERAAYINGQLLAVDGGL